jgi:alpha-L-fucosidase
VNGESVTGCGKSDFTPPYGCVYTQKNQSIYCHFLQSPLGDTILPQLKGKVEKITLLRTGKAVEQINHWGFELLKPDELRIRTRAIRPGDVVKIELRK